MFPYLLLFLSTSAYAAFLNIPRGRRFADERTAESVGIGVALVLLALRSVMPGREWLKVVGMFAVGGAPVVGRSWWNRGLKN